MSGRPEWAIDGADWPNREASRFVHHGGFRWHVQEMGRPADGAPARPVLLLLHGTGAATHSFRDLLPLLAERFHVVAPDLPGHGFTRIPLFFRLSLPDMARALAELMGLLGVAPSMVAGHSAGAAVGLRMALDRMIEPGLAVGINAAILPLDGVPGRVFSPAAKLMVANPLSPMLIAWRAGNRRRVEQLIANTGSVIDKRGLDLYARLVGRRGHVDAALKMMANWELGPLQADLPGLRQPLVLIVGTRDRAVRPRYARRVRAILPLTRIIEIEGAGHLAHEEQPAEVARILCELGASL